MSQRFKIYDASNTTVTFDYDEATDDNVKPYYQIEKGQEKSSGGQLRMQIRPGFRYKKTYVMILTEAKYISFFNLITNQSQDYFIEYTTAPTILTNNSSVTSTNNFKISFDIDEPTLSSGDNLYTFNMTIYSVNLL